MRVLKNAVAGMAFFMMMSGLWIYAISSKYGHVTVGTAGSYNFSQISPELPEMDEQPEPVLFMGLMEPPNRTAVSIMEDPTYIDVVKWSPFESAGYFIHFVKHITGNIYAIIQVFNKFSLLSGIIVLVYLALLINSGGILKRPEILYPLSTLLLFCGGYTPFIININNERYIWLANILLLFMGGHILSRLFCSESVKMNLWKNLLILIFALSFLRLPLGIIKDKPLRGEENLRIFRRLEPSGAVKGRIASNDKWGDTLQLAYYSNLADNSTQYIGIPKKPGNELEELKRYDIDVYLYWEGESEPPEFLSGFKEITEGRIPGVKAYRLK